MPANSEAATGVYSILVRCTGFSASIKLIIEIVVSLRWHGSAGNSRRYLVGDRKCSCHVFGFLVLPGVNLHFSKVRFAPLPLHNSHEQKST